MFLNSAIFSFMTGFFQKLFGKKSPPVPDLSDRSISRSQRMREALLYSEAMLSKRFDPNRARLIEFECCKPDIMSMTAELIHFNQVMEAEKGINPVETIYDFKKINLEQFFIDPQNNTYIDQYNYRLFHKAADEFCTRVHECSLEEFGRLEHNYRVLRPVIASVTEICMAIGRAIH